MCYLVRLPSQVVALIGEIRQLYQQEYPGEPEGVEQLQQYLFARIRNRLHVILCLSPEHARFGERLRKFPALVGCCYIDWFLPWPQEALLAVAQGFLQPFQTSVRGLVPFACLYVVLVGTHFGPSGACVTMLTSVLLPLARLIRVAAVTAAVSVSCLDRALCIPSCLWALSVGIVCSVFVVSLFVSSSGSQCCVNVSMRRWLECRSRTRIRPWRATSYKPSLASTPLSLMHACPTSRRRVDASASLRALS